MKVNVRRGTKLQRYKVVYNKILQQRLFYCLNLTALLTFLLIALPSKKKGIE